MLETLLGSKLRAKLLGWLFSHPSEHYFVSQLTAMLVEDSTNVSRELARLEKNGILVSMVEGKRKYYTVNRESPLFSELMGLFTSVETGNNISIVQRPVKHTEKIHERVSISRRRLLAICRRNNIKRLALFGSVLSEDFKPESDIDILVEFEPGKTPGFLKLAEIENDLSVSLGRKVNLRTHQDLSRYFRDRVMNNAEVLCQ